VYGDADESSTTGVWKVATTVATDPRGRWELATGWPTVTLQQTVIDRTTAFLRESTIPVAHWNLELEPSRWVSDTPIMPGDHCVLIVPRSLAAPIGAPTPRIVVQVSQVSLNFDDGGAMSVSVVVDEQPDIAVPTDGEEGGGG
jgi:hypothetical protein